MYDKSSLIKYLVYRGYRNLQAENALAPDTFESLQDNGVDPLIVDACFDNGLGIKEAYQKVLSDYYGIPKGLTDCCDEPKDCIFHESDIGEISCACDPTDFCFDYVAEGEAACEKCRENNEKKKNI